MKKKNKTYCKYIGCDNYKKNATGYCNNACYSDHISYKEQRMVNLPPMKISNVIEELSAIFKEHGNIPVKISKKVSMLVSNHQWDSDSPKEDRTQIEVHIQTESKDVDVKFDSDCIYQTYTKGGKKKEKYLLLSY